MLVRFQRLLGVMVLALYSAPLRPQVVVAAVLAAEHTTEEMAGRAAAVAKIKTLALKAVLVVQETRQAPARLKEVTEALDYLLPLIMAMAVVVARRRVV